MSVDSKVFVVCGNEKYIEVVNAVVDSINKYSREVLDKHWKENTECKSRMQYVTSDEYESGDLKFTNGSSLSGYSLDCLTLVFGCGDTFIRTLYILTGCHADYSDTNSGGKIVFSIGCSGKHKEIMSVVCEALKPFGKVYYDENDCDDIDFVEVV